ncbi:TIGR03013 family XrtA/PEP-CTERM system glycosyltransferase [Duganella sacchari]|nr:TIGR03013 family XrtA/PEP-CTERM system glycosyltransferase [Duganella sacchari]
MLLLLELSILLAAAVASAPLWLSDASQLYGPAVVFALVMVFSMGTLGMYQHDQSREDVKSTLLRIMPSFVLGFCLMRLLAGLLPGIQLGRLGSTVFLLGGGAVLLARLIVFTSAQSRMLEQRLIIVGDGALALECMALAASSVGFHPFRVVGFVPVSGELRAVPPAMLLPADLPLLALARRYAADEIIVTVGDRRNGAFPVRQLLECALGGVPVTDAATFFEREACQIRVDSLQPSYLIFGGGFDQSVTRAAVKRLFDLTASAAIGLIATPVMLATALAIKMDDGGPVFFRQERVGRGNRVFHVLKFRSMRPDAERDGQPRWASEGDPRVTRVGRWIRQLRIDELPQMLNVFRGDMSFVGPRPERAYFVKQLRQRIAYYNVRHGIKPGITGLAQVRYRYGASVEDAVRKVAEAAKVIENTQRDLNIALMNELAIIFDRLDIDTAEVLQAAGSKWNFLPFRPGLVGGHCIGVDPYYLTHKAVMLGYHPDVILAGRRINDGMAKFVAEKTVKEMVRAGFKLRGCRVNVLGLTFKENCPDLRNSKVADLIRELESYGLQVHVHDPVADADEAMHEYGIRLRHWDELPCAEALISAVAHKQLIERPLGQMLDKVAPSGCFIDLKSQFDAQALRQGGLSVWRL